mmetsp:Transcript_77517/g.209113  ORF Transcript_77517/g.209113 Transcript_77517/m.209113 type:complete len:256 (-) Transcript_77517:153-920(-)
MPSVIMMAGVKVDVHGGGDGHHDAEGEEQGACEVADGEEDVAVGADGGAEDDQGDGQHRHVGGLHVARCGLAHLVEEGELARAADHDLGGRLGVCEAEEVGGDVHDALLGRGGLEVDGRDHRCVIARQRVRGKDAQAGVVDELEVASHALDDVVVLLDKQLEAARDVPRPLADHGQPVQAALHDEGRRPLAVQGVVLFDDLERLRRGGAVGRVEVLPRHRHERGPKHSAQDRRDEPDRADRLVVAAEDREVVSPE